RQSAKGSAGPKTIGLNEKRQRLQAMDEVCFELRPRVPARAGERVVHRRCGSKSRRCCTRRASVLLGYVRPALRQPEPFWRAYPRADRAENNSRCSKHAPALVTALLRLN